MLVAVAAAVALRAAFFLVSVRTVPPSSDESIPVLQARGLTQPADSVAFQAKQYPPGLLGRFPLLFLAQPYCFPVDSYVMAPFAPWLPCNAVGARLVSAGVGLLTVLGGILILRRWGRWADVWPGVLLLLFPSTYWMILQAADALPGATWFLLTMLALLLAQAHRDARGLGLAAALGAGFCAGLSASGSLLMAPVIVAAGAMVGLSTRWRRALAAAPAFGVGLLLGLLPYLAAKHFCPGAYEAVSQTVPLARALERLWEPTLTFTLPVVLGITPCFWPDNPATLTVVPGLQRVVPWAWSLLMAAATLLALWQFGRRAVRDRWPSLRTSDAFIAATWLGLFLALVSRRTDAHAYRYLMFVVLGFPFIVAYLYRQSGRAGRIVLGALAGLLAALNVVATAGVMRQWQVPGFAADEASLHDVTPVVRYLQERQITRAYASWHVAYRLTYITGERVLCAQYFNERFPYWPVPYKDVVDAATNVAFVLHPRWLLKPQDFESDLASQGVTARKEQCGDYAVYTDFAWPAAPAEHKIPGAEVTATASRCPEAADALHDGNYETRWRGHLLQEKGEWVELRLPKPAPVARVSLYYKYYRYDQAAVLNVLVRTAGGWEAVATNVVRALDPFERLNGHPVLGNQLQTIRFPPVTTEAVRVEIAEPEPGRDWTIGEMVLYTAGAPAGAE